MLRKIAATAFKKQCLALLDKLPEEGLVITKHGRILARVLPYRGKECRILILTSSHLFAETSRVRALLAVRLGGSGGHR